jgi:glycosyltransferase involved in cell wall biosynthesis
MTLNLMEQQPRAIPPRILFISNTANLYGSERSLLAVVSHFKKSDRIIPLVALPSDGPLASKLHAAKVDFVVIPYLHWSGKSNANRKLLGPIRFLLNSLLVAFAPFFLRRRDIALVYTNALSTPFGALLAKKLGVPHIWHIREFLHEDIGRDFDLPRLARYLLRQADNIICNSIAVKTKWSRYLSHRAITVIYNGFDFSERPREDGNARYRRCVQAQSPPTLIFVGQIRPHKGIEDAIRAIAQLGSDTALTAQLEIVGDGPEEYQETLKDLAAKLRVSTRVVWRGFLDDPSPRLEHAAIAVVCSRNEAFGRVAVESMASGVPLVGTASGGLPEILENGRLGLLYTPGDYKALASAIRKLLNDADTYRFLSENAATSVRERFSVSKYVEGVESLIFSSLADHSLCAP